MARLEDKFRNRALGISSADRPSATSAPFNPLSQPRETLTDLSVEHIQPDPNQPRGDLGNLSELKASISSMGLVQPIIVTIKGYEQYQIVAGERRFTAVRELGLPKISAIVRTIEEHQRLEFQIVENLHRKDLNPIEEAQSYQRLIDEFGLTQEQVAHRVGKSRPAINEILRVLALPESIRQECRTSDIPKSVLLEIAKRPVEEQQGLWEQAKSGDLTVRKVRAKAALDKESSSREKSSSGTPLTFRYPIQIDDALITVTFKRHKATSEDVIAALEQALVIEKSRLG